jgi:hypothetical protein
MVAAYYNHKVEPCTKGHANGEVFVGSEDPTLVDIGLGK